LNSFLSASSSRLDPRWPYSHNSLSGFIAGRSCSGSGGISIPSIDVDASTIGIM